MDPSKEKLEALSERIRQATAGTSQGQPTKSPPARNAGFDFAGAVFGASIIGYLLDRSFGTEPWGLLGMVVFGFAAGIVGVWRTLQSSEDDKPEDKKPEAKP